jgi:hypothetical protein
MALGHTAFLGRLGQARGGHGMVASIMPNTVFMVSSIYGTEYMGGYSLDMVASIMPHTKVFTVSSIYGTEYMGGYFLLVSNFDLVVARMGKEPCTILPQ